MSQFAITNLNPHFTIVFNEKRVIIQQETAMNIKQKSPPPQQGGSATGECICELQHIRARLGLGLRWRTRDIRTRIAYATNCKSPHFMYTLKI